MTSTNLSKHIRGPNTPIIKIMPIFLEAWSVPIITSIILNFGKAHEIYCKFSGNQVF